MEKWICKNFRKIREKFQNVMEKVREIIAFKKVANLPWEPLTVDWVFSWYIINPFMTGTPTVWRMLLTQTLSYAALFIATVRNPLIPIQCSKINDVFLFFLTYTRGMFFDV